LFFLWIYSSVRKLRQSRNKVRRNDSAKSIVLFGDVFMDLKKVICAVGLTLTAYGAQSAVILSEGFENVAGLNSAGWVVSNTSAPVGTTSWFQGNPAVFAAQAGTDPSYVAANFLNTSGVGGSIINTLYTPVVYVDNGQTFSFWTKTDDDSDPGIAAITTDRLRLLFSSSGASTALVNFSELLIINPAAAPGVYPTGWTQYTATVAGLAAGTSGRFALQYNVPQFDSQQAPTFANYIGVDSVEISTVPVPAPLGLLGMGLFFAFAHRARRAR
jgi:hypothetical protein